MRRKRQVYWVWVGIMMFLFSGCSSQAGTTVDSSTTLQPTIIPAIETTFPTPTFPPLVPSFATRIAEMRSPDVPDLPFADNPDPNLCGIPTQWNSDETAWLTGYYEGELVEPIVHLYDSHMRLNITTEAPHGTEVKVLLYQNNPYIDYYLVKIEGAELPNEGWVPSPFLSFEKVSKEVGS